jgi:hypothetical protein
MPSFRQTMCWATFWATFSQTHQVTLLPRDISSAPPTNQKSFKVSAQNIEVTFLPPYFFLTDSQISNFT